MTRQEKIKQFLDSQWTTRWCKPGPMGCGCMGCINLSGQNTRRREWYSIFPDEPYFNESEVMEYNKTFGTRRYGQNSLL